MYSYIVNIRSSTQPYYLSFFLSYSIVYINIVFVLCSHHPLGMFNTTTTRDKRSYTWCACVSIYTGIRWSRQYCCFNEDKYSQNDYHSVDYSENQTNTTTIVIIFEQHMSSWTNFFFLFIIKAGIIEEENEKYMQKFLYTKRKKKPATCQLTEYQITFICRSVYGSKENKK